MSFCYRRQKGGEETGRKEDISQQTVLTQEGIDLYPVATHPYSEPKMVLIKCHLSNNGVARCGLKPGTGPKCLHTAREGRCDFLGNNTLCCVSFSGNLHHREQLQNVSGQSIQTLPTAEYKIRHIRAVDRKCNGMTSCLQEWVKTHLLHWVSFRIQAIHP